MNRITPEEIIEAYKKTGTKPTRLYLIPINGKCCALGALYLYNNSAFHDYYDRQILRYFYAKYSKLYIDNFILGFDSSIDRPLFENENEIFRLAFNDGKRCQVVFGENL